jgi:hypothetical protein
MIAPSGRAGAAETLNQTCDCSVTDLSRLQERIDRITQTGQSIVETHPNLFSNVPVFLEPHHFAQMQAVVRAVERVVKNESFRKAVLADVPAIASADASQAGVFLGYDFHIGVHGPRLIEINTNAGGAFLNVAARDHQIACCNAADEYLARLPGSKQLESSILAMFLREWQLAGRTSPLRCIAIVDDAPATQYLLPDFLLARQLFESNGIRAHIADTSELKRVDDKIVVNGEPVDLIYNRSTDFYLQSAGTNVLRDAFERNLAVVTPHPKAHALYANKHNLAVLSDARMLAGLGIDAEVTDLLVRTIPPTHKVDEGDETWWTDRKAWFFKPENGYGSRGAYRGDKMTRRVFSEVVRGGYIAQELAPPSERIRTTDGTAIALKVDIRCYAYEGEIQLMAARLYQGQTTNFRTAGGGFAPVYIVQTT